jgi:hypothetical protein
MNSTHGICYHSSKSDSNYHNNEKVVRVITCRFQFLSINSTTEYIYRFNPTPFTPNDVSRMNFSSVICRCSSASLSFFAHLTNQSVDLTVSYHVPVFGKFEVLLGKDNTSNPATN